MSQMATAVARFTLLIILAATLGAAQEQSFSGEIEVGRILTEVRVFDSDGEPVLGLQPDDFEITLGGARVEVESAEWVASPSIDLGREPAAAPVSRVASEAADDPRSGRTIVLLVQVDFESARLTGLYRMSSYAIQLVQALSPGDRVALVVYDRHLTLHLDLTNDLERVVSMLEVPQLVQWTQNLERLSEPSLVDSFDVEAAEAAATMQQGLRVLAHALEPIPGPKSIVFLGWGMGRFGSSGVVLGSAYSEARLSLARSRTSVFSLDITNAEYHTLEVGLQAVAEDTGGFYAKTHLFPESAVRKLGRVISGYYELSLVRPPGMSGYMTMEAKIRGGRATVLIRPVVLLSRRPVNQEDHEVSTS